MDSSGKVACAALLEDDVLKAEYTVNNTLTHSQTLMPMVDEILMRVSWEVSDLELIAVAAGPGSFTGLRIGAGTAKGLAHALDIPVVAVPTLEGLDFNAFGCTDIVAPMMDARRSQVYTGLYSFTLEGELEIIREGSACAIEEIAGAINTTGKRAVLLGDGADAYRDKLGELLTVPALWLPAHQSRQRASSVGVLGFKKYKAGEYVSAEEFTPEYMRLSQAERERLRRAGDPQ